MATARDIISLAFREANYSATSTVLTNEEQTEGLALLQGIVSTFSGAVTNIRLAPWFIPSVQKSSTVAANYPALSGEREPQNINNPPACARLVMRNTDDVRVYLQYQPQPGAVMEYVDAGHAGTVTLDGNGSFFGLSGSNTEEVIDAVDSGGRNPPRRWHYRPDYAAWQELTPLGLASDMPYPLGFDDYFVTALAMRLSPRFGSEPRQVTVLRYQQMVSHISNQWGQSKEVLAGELPARSLTSWDSQWVSDRGIAG